MITVSSDLLESLDQIMRLGTRGTHLLFSATTIRDAFDRQQSFEHFNLDEVADQLQPIISDLLEIDDLEDRKDFIEALDPPMRDMLVHLYFGFLERYLAEENPSEVLH